MGRFSDVIRGANTPKPAASAQPADDNGPLIAPQLVAPKPATKAPEPGPDTARMDAKMKIHSRLIDEIDLSSLDTLSEPQLRERVHDVVAALATEERMLMNSGEIRQFAGEIFDEMTGLGPLEPLLKDDAIADILINGHDQVYVERGGELEITPVRFRDEAHLLRIINRIVSQVGRRVDESMPICDARLLDGSRVNVAIAPIAVDGSLVSIRKFSKKPFTFEKLVEFGAMPKEVADFLYAACKSRVTILISGGTGSGKTTLLNALSQSISHKERLITIEDAAELQLQQPHVARMETRPPNVEGKGEIRQRELVKNALRMRPDRIVIGEVRGKETLYADKCVTDSFAGIVCTVGQIKCNACV